MTAHARLSPSSASAWMTCAGYPNANEGLPDETSAFAAEGTAAHAISDDCLQFGFDPWDFVGQVLHVDGYAIEFDEDMADALAPGIEWIRAQEGQFFGERRVNLSSWLGPDQFGTLDRGIVRSDLIIISDLKFGRGIPVSPVRNKQLMLYALGFWDNVARHISDAREFLIHIDQPRCGGGGGEWRVSLDELLAFGDEARQAAEATRAPDAPRKASKDACLWCRRKNAPGGCPTYEAFNLDLIGQKFGDLDSDEPLRLPPALTPERRSYVLQHAKMIEGWLEDLHTATLQDALRGDPTPGLKAVEGRKAPDKWRDAEAAMQVVRPILGDRAVTIKLITPTQCNKLLKSDLDRELVAPSILVGERKPALVPEDDDRPALAPITSKFDEVEEG